MVSADNESGDSFGVSIGLSNNTIIVGAFRDDDYGYNSGSVYVFTESMGAFSQSAKLKGDTGGQHNSFGNSVSVSGNRAIIGVQTDGANGWNYGAAYIFEFDGMNFIETEKLLGNSSATNSKFGSSVSINSNQLIIGAPNGFNDLAIRTGSAYVFEKPLNDWIFMEKISAGQEGSEFGDSVFMSTDSLVVGASIYLIASSGAFVFVKDNDDWLFDQWLQEDRVTAVVYSHNTILVGLPWYEGQYSKQGEVEVYKHNGVVWASSQQLKAHEDGLDEDRFGSSHSVFGDSIIVGVPGDKLNEEIVGSARIHENNNNSWDEQERLFASDGMQGDGFGEKVIMLSNQALISAMGQDSQANNAGAVYYFNNTGMEWIEAQKIIASDGSANNVFGLEMKALGDTLFVSSKDKVYVFSFNGSQWIEQQILQSGQIEDDFGQSIVIDNDRIFIGAPGDNKVYIYTNDNGNWIFQQYIPIPAGNFDDEFGISLDYFKGNLVVLSQKIESSHFDELSVYIHVFNENNDVWAIIDSFYQGFSPFILSDPYLDVAIENNNIVLTLHVFRSRSFYSSGIYFYSLINQELDLIKEIHDEYYRAFDAQMPVSIIDDMVFVGNNSDTINGTDAGSIRVFDFDPPDLIYSSGFE